MGAAPLWLLTVHHPQRLLTLGVWFLGPSWGTLRELRVCGRQILALRVPDLVVGEPLNAQVGPGGHQGPLETEEHPTLKQAEMLPCEQRTSFSESMWGQKLPPPAGDGRALGVGGSLHSAGGRQAPLLLREIDPRGTVFIESHVGMGALLPAMGSPGPSGSPSGARGRDAVSQGFSPIA